MSEEGRAAEARREMLFAKAEEARAEWIRAERAEAELAALRTQLAERDALIGLAKILLDDDPCRECDGEDGDHYPDCRVSRWLTRASEVLGR